MKRARSSIKLQPPKSKSSNLVTPPSSASKSKTEVTGTPLKQYRWKEPATIALIAAVKEHPLLWADEFRNHEKRPPGGARRAVKAQAWKDIQLELQIKGFDISVTELKTKWTNIRRSSKHLITVNGKTKWDKHLSFLGMAEPKSLKTEKVSDPVRSDHIQSELTLNGVSSSTPFVATNLESYLKMKDPNVTFCEYLLAELGMLSDMESQHLRGLLMRVVYNFENTIDDHPSQKSFYY